jgi:hypothetical protein
MLMAAARLYIERRQRRDRTDTERHDRTKGLREHLSLST